ncbi:MAG: hypothetical protein AAFQ66_09395 [Pseudomonadota bacterium]
MKLSDMTNGLQDVLFDVISKSDLSVEQIQRLQGLDALTQVQLDLAHVLDGAAQQLTDGMTVDTVELATRLKLNDLKLRLFNSEDPSPHSETPNVSGDLDLF